VKKLFVILFVMLFLMATGGSLMASVVDNPDINSFHTFKDNGTGRIWLDMNNFFNESTNDMVTAATAAGFTFATMTDVEQLLYSLPLTANQWSGYAAIMGSAPHRDLIWGSYFESASTVGWAWAFSGDSGWSIENSSYYPPGSMNWSSIPNVGTSDADMNIWAYYSGNQNVPEPTTMLLLGLGLVGLAGARRKIKK